MVNKGGEGLRLELTEDYEGFPAGTTVVVADVSASARDGARPSRPRRASPEPTAEPTATPSPEPTATPRPREPPRRATASG